MLKKVSSSKVSHVIAKNTVMLYTRMGTLMVVNLYLSRVVLDALGITDFGIYSVVGGVALLFSFLNGTLSGATSRFLLRVAGNNQAKQRKEVFNTALTIHIVLAVVILFFAETVGLWFMEYKLVIPPERLFGARIVYQVAILITAIQLIQIPFNAVILSHETMGVYAYISVFEALLKILGVYVLVVANTDKLILYSFVNLAISILVVGVYIVYSISNYHEAGYSFTYEKKLVKPMLSFSGWDLYGNISWTFSAQSINIILNVFFGSPINAACAIAGQVRNAIGGFSTNFITAVRPQIMKSYSSGDVERAISLMINSSKYSFLLLFYICLPLILECEFVLKFWLGTVPDYAVAFCRFNLLSSLISSLFLPVGIGIHATGEVKQISFVTGSIYLLSIPLSYGLLALGLVPIIPYVVSIVVLIVASLTNLVILSKHIPEFSILLFIRRSILIVAITVTVSSLIPVFEYLTLPPGITRFFAITITCVFWVPFSVYFVALDSRMQSKIRGKLISILSPNSIGFK